jgi:hypothetical protein
MFCIGVIILDTSKFLVLNLHKNVHTNIDHVAHGTTKDSQMVGSVLLNQSA